MSMEFSWIFWMSLIFAGSSMSLKSRFLAKFLPAFVILVGLGSSGVKYLT